MANENIVELKIEEGTVAELTVQEDGATLSVESGIPVYPDPYTGAYEVEPTEETQTLVTKGLMMLDHIKINPIPSNYGLITWNGSTLTVS